MPQQKNKGSIFQFKVTLNDSEPKIWRRIFVPDKYTFFDLHCAVQNAMGWAGGHLHAFYIENKKTKRRITIQCPDPSGEDWGEGEICDERVECIADYFGKTVKQCVYCYDFGDGWEHTILFERTLPRAHGKIYPQCVAGKSACPPENCGGVGGYAYLQEILKNPRHKEHADMLDWLCTENPEEFDPYEFSLSEVNFEDPKKCLDEWNKEFYR